MKPLKDNDLFVEPIKCNIQYIETDKKIGYTKISNYPLYDYELSGNAFKIYTLYLNYASKKLKITDAIICHKLKMPKETLRRYKKELLNKGYIDRKRIKGTQIIEYKIIDIPKNAKQTTLQELGALEFERIIDQLENDYLTPLNMSNEERKDYEKAKENFLNIFKQNLYR